MKLILKLFNRNNILPNLNRNNYTFAIEAMDQAVHVIKFLYKSSCKITFLFYKMSSWKFGKCNTENDKERLSTLFE